MKNTKQAFISLALESEVLRFGKFTLKSGRESPYFFNAGLFYQGESLRKLGQFYAQTLIEQQIDFKHLFGPAYKGIPLATTTAIALAEKGMNVTTTFNRKEIKDHGEGGKLIGAPLNGPTVLIDDVITAGTAFREAKRLIDEHGGELSCVIIAFDRCERGLNQTSAVADIQDQGIKVLSIINFFDVVDFLREQQELDKVETLLAYHKKFGLDTES